MTDIWHAMTDIWHAMTDIWHAMTDIWHVVPLDSGVIGIIGVLIGVFTSRWLTHKKERIETTLEIFNRWHSTEMFHHRKVAWKYLTQDFCTAPLPYHVLFNDKTMVDKEIIDSVTTVTYFWHLFYVLKKQGLISRKIESDLFKYQYSHWMKVLEPMYLATVEDGKDIPEWCEAFENKQKEWISESDTYTESHANTIIIHSGKRYSTK